MASSAGHAPSTPIRRLQLPPLAAIGAPLERWLETERDQLALWLPVALGSGVAAWFLLPDPGRWTAAVLAAAGLACAAAALGRGGRLARVVAIAATLFCAGLLLVWVRAERSGAAPLARPAVVQMRARVETVQPLPSRELVRLRLAPISEAGGARLPAHVRVNLPVADMPPGLADGSVVELGARLMPPAGPAVPGGYDFARVAWFDGLGATGRAFAPVTVVAGAATGAPTLRARLSAHIQASAPGSPGGIAAALATGDQGAITQEDADAMRRSGLAHLLSVSGLHITAVVGATMVLVLRLLALSPFLALRFPLRLIAGGAGAAAAIGYTWLTGAEVPTIRSCVAALLVLTALALGREALTLRLVAAGAFVVLVLFPDAIAGPSFQLSFAAVTAIVALHELPLMQRWFGPHDEGRARRLARELGSLLVTGLAVELALMPIGLFHFHTAGLYGALANIVAIPLTTFVTMPLEAAALLLDPVGLGGPLWWLTAWSLRVLLWIAHHVSALPGAVAALPGMPGGAYALAVGGGLWIALWRTRLRWLGAAPLAVGMVWTLLVPAPDLLVTGDGRHLALRIAGGEIALLRDRTGDYTSDLLRENAGITQEPLLLSAVSDARCNRDLCLAQATVRGRTWRVLATRSADLVPAPALIAACRSADVVVSERRLPRACRPRWLRLDRTVLARTGGVAISFAAGTITTVRRTRDRHPWRMQDNREPGSRNERTGGSPRHMRSGPDQHGKTAARRQPCRPERARSPEATGCAARDRRRQ